MDFIALMMDYVKPELLVLIPVLWYIGNQLKLSKVENWLIPLVLLGVSLGLTISWVLLISGVSGIAIWTGIVQGLVLWALEGQLFQTKKQLSER